MRLRNIPGAQDAILESPYVVQEPQTKKGHWGEVFAKKQPLHIEVGMGKGRFLMDLARLHPDINYIGIEMYDSVLLRALQKREELEENGEVYSNLFFMRVDARLLPEIFEKGEVDKIYLNFSDPWPKSKHDKRRLTYKKFLQNYEQILVSGGEIHFKTDNQGLFEYSLASFSQYGMTLKQVWLDLHKSDFEGNIMTEYEAKFSSRGDRIYRVEAAFPKKATADFEN